MGNVRGGFPRKLELISIFRVDFLGLAVDTLDDIAVREAPSSDALWLVVVEITLEIGAVWVLPLSVH